VLENAWIAAAVRCAPPDNKPTPREIAACHAHLRAELEALPSLSVFVPLGRIAFDACWRLLADRGIRPARRPAFAAGAVTRNSDGTAVVASYHPSRHNTNTGRLTPRMLHQVFRTAVRLAEESTAVTVRRTGRGDESGSV
jgi:uracil-DNA glycosylase family 4